MRSSRLATLILAAFLACAPEPVPKKPGPEPASILAVSHTFLAGPADSALDTLVVRVVDAEGRPVASVRVTWSTDAPPLFLLPLDDTTDQDGIARALWRLPPETDTKHAIASIEIDSVTFQGSVPIASVDLSPRAMSLWVGDTAHASVVVRDEAGQPLEHPIQWEVADGRVAQIDANGMVTATSVGVSALSVEGVGGSIAVRVSPPGTGTIVTGRIETLDSANDPLTLAIRYEDARGLAYGAAAPDGSFALQIKHAIDPGDTVEVGFIPTEATAVRYHPSFVVIGAGALSSPVQVLLIPRSWRIARGLYQGVEVPITVNGAFDPAGFGSFWPIAPSNAGFYARIGLWPDSAFPLAVALTPRAGDPPVLAPDSAEIWADLNRMELILGVDLFYPVNRDPSWSHPAFQADTVTVDPSSDGVATAIPRGRPLRTWIQALPRQAARFVLEFSEAAYFTGHVNLNFGLSGPPEPVHHEFMHILGIGHGCAFPSAVATCPAQVPGIRTAEMSMHDVAHYEVLRVVLQREQQMGISGSLVFALMGERVFVLQTHRLPAPNDVK